MKKQSIALLFATISILLSSCSMNVKPVPVRDEITVTPIIKVIIQQEPISLSPVRVPIIVSQTELNCVAKAVYYEAASEPPKGKQAVAFVIINRMASGKYPSSACGVVQQTTRIGFKKSCQFSWYCNNGHQKLNTIITDNRYIKCLQIARSVLSGEIDNFIPSAISFHVSGIHVNWTHYNMVKLATIGNHTFYGFKSHG